MKVIDVPKKVRDRVMSRYGGKCGYCGQERSLVTDHVTPRSQGGTNEEDNLMPACASCNRFKGHRSLQEYKAYLRIIPKGLSTDGASFRLLKKRLRAAYDFKIDHEIALAIDQWEELSLRLEKLMTDREIRFYFEFTSMGGD